MPRRKFASEFKHAAVRDVEAGASLADVARIRGVQPSALRRWQKELSSHGERAFPGYGRNRSVRDSRSESLVFRLSAEEFSLLQSAYSSSDARSLSDFARHQVLASDAVPALPNLHAKLEELTLAVRKLTERAANGDSPAP